MKAIELEGFQSIRERTKVPFRRITMLYGPNSAGKSAITDAIGIFSDFWTGKLPSRSDDVRRWAHVPKGGAERVEKFTIAVTFSNRLIVTTNSRSAHALSSYDIWNRNGPILPFMSERTRRTPTGEELGEITIALSLDSWAGAVSGFEVLTGQSRLVRLTRSAARNEGPFHIDNEGFLEVNLAHWMLRRVGVRPVHWRKQTRFSVVDNVLRLPVERPSCFRTPQDLEQITLALADVPAGPNEPAVELFGWLKNWLTTDLARSLSLALYNNHVPATRPVPGETDLVFLLEGAALEEDHDGSWIEPRRTDDRIAELVAPRINEGNTFEAYRTLAQHHAYLTLAQAASKSLGSEVDIYDEPERPTWVGANLNFVNGALSDHLFIDSGYRVEIEMRHLAPTDDLQRALAGDYDPYSFLSSPIIATISLVDSHGRRVAFSDVGSGISNILPVLVSIATSPFVSIEQPELHLHPALQSALGDVLVQGGARSTLVVETHSEQLILRLLRRIRETTAKLHEADGLKLRADEVAAIYFEPHADGTTKCHRLNISPHGDFYERWPRGFFGERYLDLFDE